MSKQQLANAMDTKRMLSMLYSDLEVAASEVHVEQDANTLYGTYIDDNDQPVSLCAFDRSFGAFLGAALTMVPKDTAADVAASGNFPDSIMDNTREVMNILSRIFMEGSSPHLRFSAIRASRAELTPAEAAILDNAGARLDMEMTVPAYGTGHCSLITL